MENAYIHITNNPRLKLASNPVSGREAGSPLGRVYVFSAEVSFPGWLQMLLLLTKSNRCRERALAFIRLSLPFLLVISYSPHALTIGQEHMLCRERIHSCQSKVAFSTTNCSCDLQEDMSSVYSIYSSFSSLLYRHF